MKRFSKWLVENDLNRLAHDFAKMKHDETGKVRKLSGKPYFTHPSNVADLLSGVGASPEVVMAGYLHDTTEDAGVSLSEISEKFGSRVAALVSGSSEPV